MAKISRKQLKRDEFREEFELSMGYVVQHRNKIIIVATLAILIGASLALYLGHRRTQRIEAEKALQNAIELYHGKVSTEQRLGMVTFVTSIERQNRITEGFEKVIKDFPGTSQASTAEYYLGLFEMEEEKYQESQKHLEAAIQSGDEETVALGHMALAEVYDRQGKDKEAREQYQYVVDHPTRLIPKERAQLALARYLAQRDPDKAREILNQLIQKPGVLGTAATATLREMGS